MIKQLSAMAESDQIKLGDEIKQANEKHRKEQLCKKE
jgi:hypothetical protein